MYLIHLLLSFSCDVMTIVILVDGSYDVLTISLIEFLMHYVHLSVVTCFSNINEYVS